MFLRNILYSPICTYSQLITTKCHRRHRPLFYNGVLRRHFHLFLPKLPAMSKPTRQIQIKREPSTSHHEDLAAGSEADADLISMDKLDSESPEIWPEKIPGVNEYRAQTADNISASPPVWMRGLKQEDINYMHQLSALSADGMIAEVRKLYDEAYKLGIEEAKEMTRGRYLGIFQAPTTTTAAATTTTTTNPPPTTQNRNPKKTE